jgi:predicted dehydrogenase
VTRREEDGPTAPESATVGDLEFLAVGWHHPHIHQIVAELLDAGARLVGVADEDADIALLAGELWGAPVLDVETALASNVDCPASGANLLVTADHPARRSALAAEAMHNGFDVVIDKPAAINTAQLAELRTAQAETGRRCVVHCSERVSSRATMAAIEMVAAGAIGRLVTVECSAPHRVGDPGSRPDWFWQPSSSGGIIADIGAHQTDQFLALVAADARQRGEPTPAARVEWASTSTLASLGGSAGSLGVEHPAFEHHGTFVLAAGAVTGVGRVDWWTPAGSPVWGDGRLMIVGTEGTIEIRKHIDPAGRDGADHLILTDAAGITYHHHGSDRLDWPSALINTDIGTGTDTAVASGDDLNRSTLLFDQIRAFDAVDLALQAQRASERD